MRKAIARAPNRTDVQLAFGRAVRRLREAKELTQEELAGATDVHVTYVSQVERGLRNISLYNIHRLAFALETTASALMLAAEQDH